MKTIRRFPLAARLTSIKLHPSDQVVHIGLKDGQLNLWALIEDTDRPDGLIREFITVETGEPITRQGQHLTTIIDGTYVYHVFEVMSLEAAFLAIIGGRPVPLTQEQVDQLIPQFLTIATFAPVAEGVYQLSPAQSREEMMAQAESGNLEKYGVPKPSSLPKHPLVAMLEEAFGVRFNELDTGDADIQAYAIGDNPGDSEINEDEDDGFDGDAGPEAGTEEPGTITDGRTTGVDVQKDGVYDAESLAATNGDSQQTVDAATKALALEETTA